MWFNFEENDNHGCSWTLSGGWFSSVRNRPCAVHDLDWSEIQGSRQSRRTSFSPAYHLIRNLRLTCDKSTANLLLEKLRRCYSMNHIDEWTSFQSTSSLPCSPHTNTVQAQYPHVARSLLSGGVTDESTHWGVKYGGSSQSARPWWRGCSPLSLGDAAAGSVKKVPLYPRLREAF